jgi:hypothetical protein
MPRATRLLATLAAAVTLLGVAATVAPAQATKGSYKRDIPSKLSTQAKKSEDSASIIALAKVPNGKAAAEKKATKP